MNQLIAKGLFWLVRCLETHYLHLMDQVYTVRLSSKFKKCGKDVHIYYPCRVTGPQFIQVGNNVHINRGAFIRAEGGVRIGDNVHIARNLTIYTINHNYMGDALPYDHTVLKKPVTIERNVWIGVNVTIVPGVSIGEGAIIGAGSVVSQDVPPLAIVGSTPQRVIRYRDKAHYTSLDRARKYGGVGGRVYKRGE